MEGKILGKSVWLRTENFLNRLLTCSPNCSMMYVIVVYIMQRKCYGCMYYTEEMFNNKIAVFMAFVIACISHFVHNVFKKNNCFVLNKMNSEDT